MIYLDDKSLYFTGIEASTPPFMRSSQLLMSVFVLPFSRTHANLKVLSHDCFLHESHETVRLSCCMTQITERLIQSQQGTDDVSSNTGGQGDSASPTISLGESDFASSRTNGNVLIDKSLFIKKFIEHPAYCPAILRPRGFGKSFNISMLKCFLDRKQVGSPELFRGMRIMKEDQIVRNHMGKHVVVFLSLKDCVSPTWAGMRKDIWRSLYRMCVPHIGSRDSPVCGPGEEICWTDLMRGKYVEAGLWSLPAGMDDYDLGEVFCSLVDRLYDFYRVGIIVLVDGFDTPLNIRFASEDDHKQRKDFFSGFYSPVLKDNSAVVKAMLVGTLDIRYMIHFSGLNNLMTFSVDNDSFSGDCFGFTESEVKDCLRTQLGMSADRVDYEWSKPGGLCQYYNGYNVGGHDVMSSLNFMKFLSHRRIESYWANSEPSQGLFKFIQERHVDLRDISPYIEVLLAMEGTSPKRLRVGRLNRSGSTLSPTKVLKGEFIYIMCMIGYLAYRPLAPTFDEDERGEVWIPNMELRLEWEKLMAQIHGFGQIEEVQAHYHQLAQALCSFDVTSFQRFVHDGAVHVSSRIPGRRLSYPHRIGAMLDLFNLAKWQSLCYLWTTQLIVFKKELRSVVIETRCSDSRDTCSQDAQAALDHIFKSGYHDHVPAGHTTLLIGVAIWSDLGEVEVKMVSHTYSESTERMLAATV